MAITSDNELNGFNLLKPGKTPHQNVRFLLFLAAVLKAVHKHAGLLRAGIASSGNEHRLGANEAPPAIISVFMGSMLTRVIEEIAEGRTSTGAEQAMIQLGVARLPEIEKDNTDRNRTSPFAFTGMKFEFRAVGSSASVAFPVMLLNATTAEALGEMTEQLRGHLAGGKTMDDAVLAVVSQAFRETKDVRFEGNGYSQEWVDEAARRGLKNIRHSPDALQELVVDQSRALFESLGILTQVELESRYHVRVERYVKDLLIELITLREMVDTVVLPAGFSYANALAQGAANARAAGITSIPQVDAANRVGAMIEELMQGRARLGAVIDQAEEMHDDCTAQASLLTREGAEAMAAVRGCCDALELVVGDDQWPLPKYREMLFPV
jgi:glutamine synthetase